MQWTNLRSFKRRCRWRSNVLTNFFFPSKCTHDARFDMRKPCVWWRKTRNGAKIREISYLLPQWPDNLNSLISRSIIIHHLITLVHRSVAWTLRSHKVLRLVKEDNIIIIWPHSSTTLLFVHRDKPLWSQEVHLSNSRGLARRMDRLNLNIYDPINCYKI
jgi:hypothetical protein